MNLQIPYYHVDAFTSERFKGNQAGVCVLEDMLPDCTMQNIATEMNLSETTFLIKNGNGYKLRWFTPSLELPLCGHGTLAAAHILWENSLEKEFAVSFQTKSGLLQVKKQSNGWIELKFPAFESKQATLPPELKELFPQALSVVSTNHRLLIELPSEDHIKKFRPDFSLLRDFRVIITSKATDGKPYDFLCRYFAIPNGVPEDPVTGSAHCSLAPFWAKKLSKNHMTSYQASARGGMLKVNFDDPFVYLSGQAITIFNGTINL